MAQIIQLRHDTAANWTAANSVLTRGEAGVETDTGKMKVGDGSTAWVSLSYQITNSSGGAGKSNAIYGDGSDGTVVFDGSVTIQTVGGGASVYRGPAGTFMYSNTGQPYQMTRDIYASSLRVEAGITLFGNYRIFVNGTLTNLGLITGTPDPVGQAGGVPPQTFPGGFWQRTSTGYFSLGAGNTTVAGTSGTASPSSTGATGPICLGGLGGAGGGANGAAAGMLTSAAQTPDTGAFRDITNLIGGLVPVSGSSSTTGPTWLGVFGGGTGGQGGRTAGTTSTTAIAGGGDAGGVMLIVARSIVNYGTITCNGGGGGNASGAGDAVTGGGGGGGGGLLMLVYNSYSGSAGTANGGAAGTGLNGASAAGAGSGGTVITLQN